MDEFYVQPENVHQIGRVWSQASEGLHEQVAGLHAGRLDPAHFGARYADQASGVTAAYDRLEGTWSAWSQRCAGFSAKLHTAATAFHASDQT
jgi:hypothetical protein